MTGRPCRPDSDFKRLWRMMLPGMSFPACGVSLETDAASAEPAVGEAPAGDEADAVSKREPAAHASRAKGE